MAQRQLALLLQHLQGEGRGGERQRQAREQGGLPGQAAGHGDRRQDYAGYGHLHAAQAEDRRPHGPQPPRAQLQADHEQQHDHAELGEVQHRFHVGDEARDRGADQHAHQEIAEHSADAQQLGERRGDHRSGEEEGDLLQGDVVHAGPGLPSSASPALAGGHTPADGAPQPPIRCGRALSWRVHASRPSRRIGSPERRRSRAIEVSPEPGAALRCPPRHLTPEWQAHPRRGACPAPAAIGEADRSRGHRWPAQRHRALRGRGQLATSRQCTTTAAPPARASRYVRRPRHGRRFLTGRGRDVRQKDAVGADAHRRPPHGCRAGKHPADRSSDPVGRAVAVGGSALRPRRRQLDRARRASPPRGRMKRRPSPPSSQRTTQTAQRSRRNCTASPGIPQRGQTRSNTAVGKANVAERGLTPSHLRTSPRAPGRAGCGRRGRS